MGAVDHEVGRRTVRLGVDLLDRLGQGLAGRESTVRLDGERHGHGETVLRRRTDDADRLFDVRDRERADDVGGRVGENAGLPRVKGLRLVGGQPALGVVGVALGADRGAEHDRAAGSLLALANRLHERDGPPVRLGEVVERVAELRAPRGVRSPRVRLEHEADAVPARDVEIRLEVAVHRRPSVVVARAAGTRRSTGARTR